MTGREAARQRGSEAARQRDRETERTNAIHLHTGVPFLFLLFVLLRLFLLRFLWSVELLAHLPKDTQTQSEREAVRDRETERQGDKEAERGKGREAERQRDSERQTSRQPLPRVFSRL